MAGVSRKISAASARSHTRKSRHNTSKLPSGMLHLVAEKLEAARPPPPKICGSPGGPAITAHRIKLRDGRHLAYKEHGVSKQGSVEELGVYVVSFDRPGYGESDPNPKRTMKSLALDVEELADQLELGPKFYVVGYSMGGQAVWGCLKYIPHRLAGATLIAPVINYWWPGFPANLSKEAYYQQFPQDQWALRVAHYTPWLTYWWNTQKLFPASSVIGGKPQLSRKDMEIIQQMPARPRHLMLQASQQGEFESIHRDLMIGFGSWEFDPLELENPFLTTKGKLSWIQYHEVPGAGHLFPIADGMTDVIVKALLLGEK
ncbi:hypothetical protein CK203_034786 [Vitis vinifera]|uniref:AB hydrolase-1 domain-containing protein n=1 Tax=Vitis vinifera TaxID=29760 RepID=A0A438IC18_VITVI|nr:hypothetical protein CK203_034786 [Vitis vinifera]